MTLPWPYGNVLFLVPLVVVDLFGTEGWDAGDTELVRETRTRGQVKTRENIVQGEASESSDDAILILRIDLSDAE